MSTLVRITPSQVEGLLAEIRAASALTDLTETRARIEAARAWAKVHKQVKELRLDLLRVEVEALVRIVELGGVETLPARDRKPAKHLAGLTFDDRASLVAQSGVAITTAAGMVRAIWTAEDLEQERVKNKALGRALATSPDLADSEDDLQRYIKETTYRVEDVLSDLVDTYASADGGFTINDLAEDVIRAASLGSTANDPDVEEGIREVCRQAVRRAPVVKIDGTILPRFVTAKSDDGHHVRLPVENATLAHLDQMIEGRRQQLAQDEARLRELETVAARLRKAPGAGPEARIGDLIAGDLLDDAERRSA